MKHILCFGDSNTWGYIPGSGGQRYDLDQRWTGILQQELGAGARVIEEGLNGRTTLWEDPTVPLRRSGLAWLPACLDSHRPLDLVVLMLGTNDLKVQFALTPEEIAFGAARLVREVLAHPEWGPDGVHPPQVLLVSPIHVHREMPSPQRETFGGLTSHQRSLLLAQAYQKQAELLGCRFFDAAAAAEPSPLDGIHLDARSHRSLALVLARQIRTILA